MSEKLIPISEFSFPELGPEQFTLTCRNHPTVRYSTKNPYHRSLHILRFPDELDYECACPFSDLVVIAEV
jgi:hypothetical protein